MAPPAPSLITSPSQNRNNINCIDVNISSTTSILISSPPPKDHPKTSQQPLKVTWKIPHHRPSQVPLSIRNLPKKLHRVARAAYDDHIEELHRSHARHDHGHHHRHHHHHHKPSHPPKPAPWRGSHPRTSSLLLPVQTSRYSARISTVTCLYMCPRSMSGSDGKMVLHSPNQGDVVSIDWAAGKNSAPRLLYAFEKADAGKEVSAGRKTDYKKRIVGKRTEEGMVGSARKKSGRKLRAAEKTKGEMASERGRPKARVYPKLVPTLVFGKKPSKYGFEEGRAKHRKEEWGQAMRIKWHPHTW